MKNLKQNVKKGDIIKVTNNAGSGHNYNVGEKYRVISVPPNSSGSCYAESLDGKWKGNNLIVGEYEIVGLTIEDFKQNGNELKEKIEKIQSDIKQNDEIIQWMTDMNIKEYDENEHRVFVALTTIEDNNLSKIQKAKLISELIK